MAQPITCCICGEALEPPYNIIAGRAYCARHYAAVNRSNSGFWRASVVQILGMGAFSAILALLGSYLGPLSQTGQLALGVFLAVVPSALWLYYFYRQDRLEPEPKTQIAAVFLVALVLTDVLGRRIIDDVFQVGRWSLLNTGASLGAAILIQGFTWQAITYIAVRVVYATAEFDERMDGIVYGTVAGLGVATLLNLRYITDNAGVELTPGIIRVVTTALAQASFGGLMGYAMAQAKFEHRPIWWVPLGVALAAVCNGLFTWLIGEVSVSGLTVNPWRSLALGVAVALAAFFVLVGLMRRTTDISFSRAK